MKILVIIFVSLLYLNCSTNQKATSGQPDWVEKKIDRLETEPVTNPPASIYSYLYKGEKVYYFPAPCCDFMSKLFNEAGELLCHPDGGITGRGDGKCPDFFESRSEEELVWQDNRGQ